MEKGSRFLLVLFVLIEVFWEQLVITSAQSMSNGMMNPAPNTNPSNKAVAASRLTYTGSNPAPYDPRLIEESQFQSSYQQPSQYSQLHQFLGPVSNASHPKLQSLTPNEIERLNHFVGQLTPHQRESVAQIIYSSANARQDPQIQETSLKDQFTGVISRPDTFSQLLPPPKGAAVAYPALTRPQTDQRSNPVEIRGPRLQESLPAQTGQQTNQPLLPVQTGQQINQPLLPVQTGQQINQPLLPVQTGQQIDQPLSPIQTGQQINQQLSPIQTGQQIYQPLRPIQRGQQINQLLQQLEQPQSQSVPQRNPNLVAQQPQATNNRSPSFAQCPATVPGDHCMGSYHPCQQDGHCQTGARCCSDACGRVCMQPISSDTYTFNPGSLLVPHCPERCQGTWYPPRGSNPSKCDAVHACSAGTTCCFNGCINICRSPNQPPQTDGMFTFGGTGNGGVDVGSSMMMLAAVS